jgi:hypothetical protein
LSKKEQNGGLKALKIIGFGDKKRDKDDKTVDVATFISLA